MICLKSFFFAFFRLNFVVPFAGGGASTMEHETHFKMGNSFSCCGILLNKQYNGVSSEEATSKISGIGGGMIEMEKIQYDNNGKIILDNNNQPIVRDQKPIHNNIGAKLFDFMKKNKEDDSRILKNNNLA